MGQKGKKKFLCTNKSAGLVNDGSCEQNVSLNPLKSDYSRAETHNHDRDFSACNIAS